MEPITIIIYLILLLLVIFTTREIVLWFWKINENIRLHHETNRLLNKIVEKLDSYDYKSDYQNSGDITDVNDPKILSEVIEILNKK